ncbi:MAG: Glu/Leu/Phe/Val dehydrogenase dimerization domain-containing protein [Longimicrobiaceae bacterium]
MSQPAPPLAISCRTGVSLVWRRYAAFLLRPPLLTVEWTDDLTPARGWLVINSLRGGAAGGGTRMREGLTRREVVYLAKTMELKFLISGPEIGGAKSGISYDPSHPARKDVLHRWFRAVAPQLREVYGTGGDLNVDEVLDVIPACAEVGLAHPQEGVVRGHLRPGEASLPGLLAGLDRGVRAPVDGQHGVVGTGLTVADLVTGYGVARSIIHLYQRRGQKIAGARVLVEGFGAVGGPCALYLARAGARVVGISDRSGALTRPGGMGAEEVEGLLRGRLDKLLPRRDQGQDGFHQTPADVFVAAASSGTLDKDTLARLAARGVSVIACGANQPFREAKLGATAVQRAADRRFEVIPDVIANCGMARAFSHLMDAGETGPAAIFGAVDRTIGDAIGEITDYDPNRRTGLLAATLEYSLDRLERS